MKSELEKQLKEKGLFWNNHVRRWHFLEHLIAQNGWTIGAELGVFKGQTFLYLMENCPGLTLYGVDLWKEQPDVPGQEYNCGRDFDGFLKDIRSQTAGNAGARIIQDYTVAGADQVEDGSLDFVFIDADHSREAVRADIMAWQPKLKPGGCMTGHDIHMDGVREAVAEFYPNYTTHLDNCWMQDGRTAKI